MEVSDKLTDELEKPALTSQQYAKMAEINARILVLKQNGFDLREHLDSAKQEVARIEGELEKTRNELLDQNKGMQECYENFIFTPFGISGQITVAETEPHYISVAAK